jgi:hypothetical protein
VRTVLITIAVGRHAHLRRQHAAVSEQEAKPDLYLCVTMGDPTTPALSGLTRIWVPSGPEPPLAAARNAGAAAAIRKGAELLIFLDVVVEGVAGQLVEHPLVRTMDRLERAAAGFAESLGLTPAAERRIGRIGVYGRPIGQRRRRIAVRACLLASEPPRVMRRPVS